MYVQIIEFELLGMTAAEYEAFCEKGVPMIAQAPGVLGKLFLTDSESNRRGAVYTFTDREAAEAYVGGELFQTAIAGNPAITNVRVRGSEVLEGPTRALDRELTSVAEPH